MFLLQPAGPSGFSSSASIHAAIPASNNVLVCSPMLWPVPQAAESWHAIYTLAYEQLLTALAPSPLQRALEPSVN